MKERYMRKKNTGSVSPLEKHSSLTFSLYHVTSKCDFSVSESEFSFARFYHFLKTLLSIMLLKYGVLTAFL